MPDELAPTIAAVRAFTRFYTRIIGLLDKGLLQTSWSMTEARVLYELAQREETDLIRLRTDLGIDSGYMTRIVDRLRRNGLVDTRTSDRDRRRRVLSLTDRGTEAFGVLNERSADQVAALLRDLNPAEQRLLVSSMDRVRSLLSTDPGRRGALAFREPEPGDFGWIIERHGRLYADEFGWDERFEALVARIVADYMDNHDPSRERCWVAERDGMRVGCVFCVRQDDDTAKLRLLLVDPVARGSGLGRELVRRCIDFAREAGYRRMALWTNDVLIGARHIYESEGFRLVERVPHTDFGQPMVGEIWELTL